MKRLLTHHIVLFCIASMLVVVVPTRSHAAPTTQATEEFIPAEIIVQLVQASDLAAVAAAYALEIPPLDQFGTRPIYRLRILDGVPPPTKAETLINDSRIVFAEPNFVGQTPENIGRRRWASGGTVSQFAYQWAGRAIRLSSAHRYMRGAGTTVAVLDTGVDISHPRFANRLVAGYDFVDGDDTPAEEGTRDNAGYGHGTHVAGVVSFVAPQAKIMPVRVLDEEGYGNIWVLAEAVAFAADPNGDGDSSDAVDVINLSLSTLRPTNLMQLILSEITCYDDDDDCEANNPDIVVVAAAGNDHNGDPNTPIPTTYPAAELGIIGVAASTITDRKALFSNYNQSANLVDITAPGVGIISTVPGGYGSWQGTSMAAPFVAGSAALLRSRVPTIGSNQIMEWLKTRAINIDTKNPDYSGKLGVGRLNLGAVPSLTP